MRRTILFALAMPLLAVAATAENAPYAGQETRDIKALSSERIAGLRAGAGLGYALSAELNGWPGPLHVLELANELALSADQAKSVEAIRADMLAEAKSLGEQLIDAEAALDAMFTSAAPDAEAISEATSKVAMIEAQLRASHLKAHIETTPLLTRHQRMIYARARGYGGGGHGGKHGAGHGGKHGAH